VILDANIPPTQSAGTNQDVILAVTSSELHFWTDPDAPLLIRADQPVVDQLTVRFVLYGFSAFTAGRYPAVHGTVTGTGFASP
jgi:hypothetical protein